MSGPAVAGMLAQRTGSFSAGFFLAAALTIIAIVLCAFLKPPGGNASAARAPGDAS
jgi:cyanate permease